MPYKLLFVKLKIITTIAFIQNIMPADDFNSKEFAVSLRNGNESAFTLLHKQFYIPLCSYAFRILNDDTEAKEVVHSTFCKIWDNRQKIIIEDSLKAYLYKSVYNNCISLLRKKKQYEKYVELGLADLYFSRIVQNPHAELKLIDSENRRIILDAINDLPDRCREIFIKCKIDGLTYPVVAEELNISVKTVEAQMTAALKKLRKNLDWLLILILP
jgi:RNA polymerase sigma-70 factor (ECF subfamily)